VVGFAQAVLERHTTSRFPVLAHYFSACAPHPVLAYRFFAGSRTTSLCLRTTSWSQEVRVAKATRPATPRNAAQTEPLSPAATPGEPSNVWLGKSLRRNQPAQAPSEKVALPQDAGEQIDSAAD
jgi:hypothetical protein